MIIMQKSPMSCNCVIYSIDVIVVANDEYRGYHQPTSPPKSFMWHIHSICIYIYTWLEAPNGLALAFIRSLRIFLFFVSFSFNSFIICMCTVYSGTFYVLRFFFSLSHIPSTISIETAAEWCLCRSSWWKESTVDVHRRVRQRFIQ